MTAAHDRMGERVFVVCMLKLNETNNFEFYPRDKGITEYPRG
jgi:hypothetical protein